MTTTAMTRRQALTLAGSGIGLVAANAAPSSTVAIARCRTYDAQVYDSLRTLTDQCGGLGKIVKGKTVALKLNLTGNPARYPTKPELPYRNDPVTVLALCRLMAKAGAERIRLIESFFPARRVGQCFSQ